MADYTKVNEAARAFNDAVDEFRTATSKEVDVELKAAREAKAITAEQRKKIYAEVRGELRKRLSFHFSLATLMNEDDRTAEIAAMLRKLVGQKLDEAFDKVIKEIK